MNDIDQWEEERERREAVLDGDQWTPEELECARRTAARLCPTLTTDAAKMEFYRECQEYAAWVLKNGAPQWD